VKQRPRGKLNSDANILKSQHAVAQALITANLNRDEYMRRHQTCSCKNFIPSGRFYLGHQACRICDTLVSKVTF